MKSSHCDRRFVFATLLHAALILSVAGGLPGVVSAQDELQSKHHAELRDLKRFFNGEPTPAGHAAAKKYLARSAHLSAIAELLAVEVGALGPQNFRTESRLLSIVVDGNLGIPIGLNETAEVRRRREALQTSFASFTRRLRSEESNASLVASAQVRRVLETWRVAACAEGQLAEVAECDDFSTTLSFLLDRVLDPRREISSPLHDYLVNGGHHVFCGGTVADLCRFLLEEHVSVVLGEEAHRKLAPLAAVLLESAAAEQQIDERLFQRRKDTAAAVAMRRAENAKVRQAAIVNGAASDYTPWNDQVYAWNYTTYPVVRTHYRYYITR
jgi:hypothetical protein